MSRAKRCIKHSRRELEGEEGACFGQATTVPGLTSVTAAELFDIALGLISISYELLFRD